MMTRLTKLSWRLRVELGTGLRILVGGMLLGVVLMLPLLKMSSNISVEEASVTVAVPVVVAYVFTRLIIALASRVDVDAVETEIYINSSSPPAVRILGILVMTGIAVSALAAASGAIYYGLGLSGAYLSAWAVLKGILLTAAIFSVSFCAILLYRVAIRLFASTASAFIAHYLRAPRIKFIR